MKYRWFRGVFAALVASFIALPFQNSKAQFGDEEKNTPEARTWMTKDGKHSVEATLLKHSPVDVTLKLANGTTKTIKLFKDKKN